MSDFRENYIKAREIIADELKEKYNLVESYRENDRLTLDSDTHSIHLTFFVPDGDEVSISEKGKQPGEDGQTFFGYLIDKYPDDNERTLVSKKLYQSTISKYPHDNEEYSIKSIFFKFLMKISFLEKEYSQFFQSIY